MSALQCDGNDIPFLLAIANVKQITNVVLYSLFGTMFAIYMCGVFTKVEI